MNRPKLFLYVGGATHFLRWELPEFARHFNLVDEPGGDTILLSFGPDVLDEASRMPARKRFAVLFPGFGHNPLHNLDIRKVHEDLIKNFFDGVFINPGPLELAYSDLDNIFLYPFSVDVNLVKCNSYRKAIKSLIHVSNDGLQKDWERSAAIMEKTGLKNEVYPPRNEAFYKRQVTINELKNRARKSVGLPLKKYLPHGYVDHQKVIRKYQQYDGFVHIAKDIKHQGLIDGKYTASLIEAGLTGSILFWHDTFSLGNNLETVFSLPLDIEKAAEKILEISKDIDVEKHSRLTREEMFETFSPHKSVSIRADIIKSLL